MNAGAKMKSMRPQMPGAGMLASKFGTSLPVTIPGRFWPPKDAKDSYAQLSSDDENEGDDGDGTRVHHQHHHQRTVSTYIFLYYH